MQAVVFYVQNEYLLTKTAMQFAPWFFHTIFLTKEELHGVFEGAF